MSQGDDEEQSLFYTLFQEHPNNVGESYFEHMGFALRVATALFLASMAALIHALVPRFHATTASSNIKQLYKLVQPRN